MASNDGNASVVPKFRGKSAITSTEFAQIFKEYDKDGNGYIEAAELDSFLKDLFKEQIEGSKTYEEFKQWLMSKGDTVNKDGKIEKDELALILPTRENFIYRFRENSTLSIVDFLKTWHSFDTNRSGYLEKNEIEEFCRDIFSDQNFTDYEIKENIDFVMKEFDFDKDGRLNIQEMADLLKVNDEENLLRSLLNGRHILQGSFDNLFKQYDKDGNGEISYDELINLLKDSLELLNKSATSEEVALLANDFMAAYDTNKDQKLSRTELELYFIDKHAV